MIEQAVLGLGANEGDRIINLQKAIELRCAEESVSLVTTSSVYETEPMGVSTDQEHYLNQVVIISTQVSPVQLLALCQEIEAALGRPGNHAAGEPRTIDIDIIAYGSLIHHDSKLVLPHPAYTRRKFVLVPLAEVLPEFRDPRSGHSIQKLLTGCRDQSVIHRYEHAECVRC